MSDMKAYEGEYSYEGSFKHRKDGINVLEVRGFTYSGKYYRPKETIKFIIKEEPDDWISVKDDSIAVTEGGKTLEEALGNAFMMAAEQYEELVSIPDSKAKHVREVRDKFRTWEVYVIDRKAQ
jgi:hypothetical protein